MGTVHDEENGRLLLPRVREQGSIASPGAHRDLRPAHHRRLRCEDHRHRARARLRLRDLLETIDLIRRIYERHERADCYTNIFTPYPGSPAWHESLEKGRVPPASLEEWADCYPRLTVLPWFQGKRHRFDFPLKIYTYWSLQRLKAPLASYERF
jgi:hypothetical protein